MSDQNPDPELKAIEQVVQALGSLDTDARDRVVAYVFQRLGLSEPKSVPKQDSRLGADTAPPSPSMATPEDAPTKIQDIRSFTLQKNPKTDNEMAVVVAYYLKYLAPAGEKMNELSKAEIEKYFVQANYPLPKRPDVALTNAKAAGYFDSAGRGLYKLNPVGHNLVTHGMGQGAGGAPHPVSEDTRKRKRR